MKPRRYSHTGMQFSNYNLFLKKNIFFLFLYDIRVYLVKLYMVTIFKYIACEFINYCMQDVYILRVYLLCEFIFYN